MRAGNQMHWFHAKAQLMIIAGLLVCSFASSCSDSSFSGGGERKQKGDNATKGTHPDPVVPQTPENPAVPGSENVDFDASKNCFKVQPTFHFMFAIDKTRSMDRSILTVIQNVSNFSKKIGTMTLKGASEPIKGSKFGAVTYIDQESENMYVDFTGDANGFSTQLNVHQTTKRGSGRDSAEGGLMAARVGLERLAKSISAGSHVVPVLIVISDTFSHDGTGGENNRSDNASGVVQAAKQSVLKPLLLIDATPKLDGLPVSPALQWEKIRSQIAPIVGRSVSALGGGIDFHPLTGFDGNQLLNTIPSLIQSSVEICK